MIMDYNVVAVRPTCANQVYGNDRAIKIPQPLEPLVLLHIEEDFVLVQVLESLNVGPKIEAVALDLGRLGKDGGHTCRFAQGLRLPCLRRSKHLFFINFGSGVGPSSSRAS